MKRNTIFFFFLVACFLQAGTYGLVFLLPPLFAKFGGSPADVGNILTATTIATLVAILYSGHITARIGYINTIACAGILLAVALVIMASANSTNPNLFFSLFFAATLLGAGWGLFYTLTPVAIDAVIMPHERVKFFTLISVSIMAGFGLSPVLGAEIEKNTDSIAITFYIVAASCLLSSVIFSILKKPLKNLQGNPQSSKNASTAPTLTIKNFAMVLRSRARTPIVMVAIGSSVFVCMTNYQTLIAQNAGLNYANFFLAYTSAVILCRILFAKFSGGRSPYTAIASFLAIMVASITLFLIMIMLFHDVEIIYVAVAATFGVGYGVAYPIIKAMAANEAEKKLLPQTMQIFGFSYFLFIFGFPFIAGRIIVSLGIIPLVALALILSVIECAIAAKRARENKK